MQQLKFTVQARHFLPGFFSVMLLLVLPAFAQNEAVVATSHPLASRAGMSMLQAGGNAVDAAAAIQFALNVVEPQSSGIGGGAFILIYHAATHQIIFLDARETAPKHAQSDQLLGRSFAQNSTQGVSVGVPGTLAGFDLALKKYGHKTLAQTLEPAINLAQEGFPVGSYLARALKSPRAQINPETRRWFLNEQGQPWSQGDILKQPDLARSFRLIQEQGPRAFYQGPMAEAMVAAQTKYWGEAKLGGPMDLEDLNHYQVVERPALRHTHGDYQIFTAPAPSAGGLGMLQSLALLEPFKLHEPGFESTQLTTEAMRLWLADRARWVGDPAATPVPQQALLSAAHIATGQTQIQPQVRMQTPHSPSQLEGDNTTQFTVVDHQGNVVSVTSTIESLWGSGIMVPGYGFLLNNELTDFNQVPQKSEDGLGANDLRPGMRPRSSMAPTLVFENHHFRMAYGSPGGLTIISTVLEFTQDMLDFKLSPEEALALKRFAVMDAEGSLLVEEGFPATQRKALEDLGYPVATSPIAIGSVQWVGEDPNTHERTGAADPRRDGTVLVAP